MKTVTLPVKGLNFAGCGREIEKRLGKIAPIHSVEASYVSQTATITYDEDRMTEGQLRKLVEDCGYACGEPLSTRTVPTLPVEQEGPAMHGEDGLRASHAVHARQSAAPQHIGTHPEMEHGPPASAHSMAGM